MITPSFREQAEIAFPGGIRPEFIRSVRQMRNSNGRLELVRIIINPSFRGVRGLPDVIIPEGTEIIQWDPANSQQSKAGDLQTNSVDPMKRPGNLQPDPIKDSPTIVRRTGDGEYQISTSLVENKVLDIRSDVGIRGTMINTNVVSDSQNWIFTYDGDKKAYLIHRKKGNQNVLLLSYSNGS